MSKQKRDEKYYEHMRVKIQSLIDECFSTHKIANELGLNDGTVRWWIRKLRFTPAKNGKLVKGNKLFKRCPKCNCVKEVTSEQFYIRDGNKIKCCKLCFLQDFYIKHKGFKQKCVDYKGGKCKKCGYFKCLAAMDFHHLDPSQKDYQISEIRSKQWEVVKKELDKTILLCRNCHAELHDEEGWKHN